MIEPPCVAVIFTSTRTADDAEGYAAMASRMEELAAAQAGFVGVHSVRDPDSGEGITVSYWRDEAAARAWRAVSEHATAQALGRDRWYSRYEVVVAEVMRTSRHDRHDGRPG